MLRECARTGYRAGNDGCTLHASVHCAAACAFTILGTGGAAASGGQPLEAIGLVDRPAGGAACHRPRLGRPVGLLLLRAARRRHRLPLRRLGRAAPLRHRRGRQRSSHARAATHRRRAHVEASSTEGLLLLGSAAPGDAGGGGGDAGVLRRLHLPLLAWRPAPRGRRPRSPPRHRCSASGRAGVAAGVAAAWAAAWVALLVLLGLGLLGGSPAGPRPAQGGLAPALLAQAVRALASPLTPPPHTHTHAHTLTTLLPAPLCCKPLTTETDASSRGRSP